MSCCQILCVVLCLLAGVSGCNEIPLTRVGDARAVCLDGSGAGYYYSTGSEEGSSSWIVYLNGGGWSTNIISAESNKGNSLGSTKNITGQVLPGMLSSNTSVNPDFYNWHRVLLHYCDGASFLGDSELYSGAHVFQFRGSRIFSAVVDELLQKGLSTANNVILAGGSAGGLATILHCDDFRASLPLAATVKCVSDAGFFITGNYPPLPNPTFVGNNFKHLIDFQNLISFLPHSCTSTRNASLCLLPEYLVGDIQTPLFLLNSAFDSDQLTNEVKPYPPDLHWQTCLKNTDECTPYEQQYITEFGKSFLNTLDGIPYNPSRGFFINACYSHSFTFSDTAWNSSGSPKLGNKTMSEAISDWFFNRSSVHLIDTHTQFPFHCPT